MITSNQAENVALVAAVSFVIAAYVLALVWIVWGGTVELHYVVHGHEHVDLYHTYTDCTVGLSQLNWDVSDLSEAWCE